MYPYFFIPYPHPYPIPSLHSPYFRQGIRGVATWTVGGETTKCGIPWSDQEYMTVAVGEDSSYQCGDLLKIRNISAPYGREIIVKVVDEVSGYGDNQINLHRNAFEALGVNPAIGRLNVEIIPSPHLETEKWGKYLLEATQVAYPAYQITEYQTIRKIKISDTQWKETYEFTLQSQQETIKIQGNVIYDPQRERIQSFDIKEI